MVDENLAHNLRCESEEMDAIAIVPSVTAGESEIGFVHQCGWLQGMIASSAGKAAAGNTTQLVVNKGYKSVSGGNIARVPTHEQFRHNIRRCRWHAFPQATDVA